MSRKQAARARPGKAEVERKRDERAARRAVARERRNRAQGEGEHDGGGLNEQLRALGLRLREVPGDGNCLFRALGDQLEGHSRNHLKHRQDTVAYMIQQRSDFEPFVEDDVPFEKHIANLSQPGTFAGNDAIVAFARNNQVNIVIHQQNAPLWQIHGTDKSNARELHIAYRYGEHYDSVRKVNDNSAAPAWLQTEMLCQNESPNKEAPQAKGERQQPKEETGEEMEDALQKVHNATGCSDVDLIAQVLEAEGYSIESAIFAVFQMKELEKLRAEEDQANRPNPQPRPALWDEKGGRGRTLGPQEVENNNNPRGNLVERNRPGQKVSPKQKKELQRLEKKKRQEDRHRQRVLAGKGSPSDNNTAARRDPQAQVTLVKTFATLSI
ncbi:PREDICTED: OTU domain-containing protein 3 [Thamnophis sirtalis]|uniref:OTU domain-containing protein 3 n=1 Tax=Thamnophis sirtalis TaxID=35019 RepID=A0A6I9YSC9_9SAUR|nr:PREDICTED: OTU domain-containing protein 3 [Thamnophis sirtalis]